MVNVHVVNNKVHTLMNLLYLDVFTLHFIEFYYTCPKNVQCILTKQMFNDSGV
jgi:hypothetical protein